MLASTMHVGCQRRCYSDTMSNVVLNARVVRPKVAQLRVRASAQDKAVNTENVVKTLSEKWENVQGKKTILVAGAAAFAALWVSSTVVNVVHAVPLVWILFFHFSSSRLRRTRRLKFSSCLASDTLHSLFLNTCYFLRVVQSAFFEKFFVTLLPTLEQARREY